MGKEHALVLCSVEAALATACMLAVLASRKAITVQLEASRLFAVAPLWLTAVTSHAKVNLTSSNLTSFGNILESSMAVMNFITE